MKPIARFLIFLLVWTVGCVSVSGPVPQPLLEARQALERARSSAAPQLAPDEYKSAQQQLEQAEASARIDPNSLNTDDLAFEAQAYARIAEHAARYQAAHQQYLLEEQQLEKRRQRLDELTVEASRADSKIKDFPQPAGNRQMEKTNSSGRLVESPRSGMASKEIMNLREQAQRIPGAQVKIEERKVILILPGALLFVPGTSRFQPGSQTELTQVAALLKAFSEYRARVEGYTDNSGDLLADNILSQACAESVVAFLTQQGRPLDSLSAYGLGSSRPLAPNDNPQNRFKNRRLEIVLEKMPAVPGAP